MSSHALIGSYVAEGPVGSRRLRPPLDDLDRNELAVLRWLLWRFNDKTRSCVPSDADIALGTGLSARSTERARIGLRKRGLIDWRERRTGGKRGSNEYDLTASLTVCEGGQPDRLAVWEAELTDKNAAANRQNGAELPDRLAEESNGSKKEKEKEKALPLLFSEGNGKQQQPTDLSVYDEEVKAAEVLSPLVRTQALAEHGEMRRDLERLEHQFSANPSPHTERAIETQRVEIGNLEGEHPDLFGGVAA